MSSSFFERFYPRLKDGITLRQPLPPPSIRIKIDLWQLAKASDERMEKRC